MLCHRDSFACLLDDLPKQTWSNNYLKLQHKHISDPGPRLSSLSGYARYIDVKQSIIHAAEESSIFVHTSSSDAAMTTRGTSVFSRPQHFLSINSRPGEFIRGNCPRSICISTTRLQRFSIFRYGLLKNHGWGHSPRFAPVLMLINKQANKPRIWSCSTLVHFKTTGCR